MSLISSRSQENRLNEYKCNIKTTYTDGNNYYERNTDNRRNDNFKRSVRIKKQYYINNELKHKEELFDTRITYSYKEFDKDKDYTCPNCGMTDKINNNEGCPYCGTYYNLEYLDKDLGTKEHFDLIVQNSTYRVITYIIALFVSFIICFLFFKATGRTYVLFDFLKTCLYSVLLSAILYIIFYYLDALIVLMPIRNYKEKKNREQMDFFKRLESMNTTSKTFFNNLNYELQEYFYNNDKNKDIIDYDIIDYNSYKLSQDKDDNSIVKVNVLMRIVKLVNNKIKIEKKKMDITLKRINGETIKLDNGINTIKCHNCGASIDVTKNKCEYCGTHINYYQEWYLVM